MLPLPLAPLLTPTPGCWAWLMSTEGCETEPLAPPETPAPVEAGGVTMAPPPAPTDAPAPADPAVWAWAIETTVAAQTRAIAKVLIILIPTRVGPASTHRPGARVQGNPT